MRLVAWIEHRRHLGWWLSAIVLVIAAGDAWASRHAINPDGISYLDVGNVVFAHGIRAGANVAWSPAYTWLVGAALQLVGPSRPHELLVVMAINLVIVAVTLLAFAWFMRELLGLLRHRHAPPPISEPILLLLGYAVLAWALLRGITAGLVTPDMLLAAVGFAATASLARIARLGGSPAEWLGLGVLLGVGYLVKSGFLIPALVACAACAVLTAGGERRGLGALALTLGVCLCVAGPFVAVLSNKEGKLELSEYGTLNYAWDVDGVTQFLNWTGGSGAFGRPVHPTLIATAPLTFAYASPVQGSIPVWYDPAYWYQGVRPRLVLGGQVRALAKGVWTTLHAIVIGPLVLLLIPLVLLWRGRPRRAPASDDGTTRSPPWWRRALRALHDHAYLALAVAGIATYLPLLVEARYIAAYVAILVIAVFALICRWLGRRDLRRTALNRGALATVLVAIVTLAYAAVRPADHVATELAGSAAPGTNNLLVARALTRAGIGPGQRIAFIGESDGVLAAYWARLAGARVVGNIEDPHGAFWRLPGSAQSTRLAFLEAHSGARAVVTDEPEAARSAGWIRIAGTADSYRTLGSG